jgi:predicted RNA-binding protein YlxR (DUF448 family)
VSKRQQRRQKHAPRRTCVVCRETLPKRQLTRLVRTPEGVRIDPTGKLAGRGAYLCDQAACWQKAAQGDALGRTLKTELTDEERAMIAAYKVQH